MPPINCWTSVYSLFCVFTIVSHCNAITEHQISPRTIKIKYGNLRGLLINFSNKNLQPVEMFLGKSTLHARLSLIRLRYWQEFLTHRHQSANFASCLQWHQQFGLVCAIAIPLVQSVPRGFLRSAMKLKHYNVWLKEDLKFWKKYKLCFEIKAKIAFISTSILLPTVSNRRNTEMVS